MVENREKQHSQDEALNAQDARPVYTAPQVMRLRRHNLGEGGMCNNTGNGAGDTTPCASGNLPYTFEQCIQGSYAVVQCNIGLYALTIDNFCQTGDGPDTGCRFGTGGIQG